MITMFLTLALAAEPLAGVRLDRAPGLGLGEPVPVAGTDAWKAAAPGGFATVSWWPTAAEAQAEVDFNLGMLRGALPALELVGASVAHGDAGMVVARRDNLVVIVRGEGAPGRAEAILAAADEGAVTTGAPAPVPGIERRDGYGRRVR